MAAMTVRAAPRSSIPSVPNFRDIGGLPTADGGWVRRGLLYRSAALDRVADADLAALARLGIRTVYDLRSRWERERAPDRAFGSAEFVALDVIGTLRHVALADLMQAMEDPATAERVLGGTRAEALWRGQFTDFVTDPEMRAAFGRLIGDLARPEHRPALVHCTTGKDRTGWAVAVLLGILGVADEVATVDFERSAELLRPMADEMAAQLSARGVDPALFAPILASPAAYLETGRAEVRRRYGSLEAYVSEGLGVGPDVQQALRAAFVERA